MSNDVYIYKLVDPRNDLPRYVGKTKQPGIRLSIHISRARTGKESSQKSEWILELNAVNLTPKMHLLETLQDDNLANTRERYWINKLLNQGHSLLNTHIPPVSNIGELLRQARNALCFTQGDMADAVGVHFNNCIGLGEGRYSKFLDWSGALSPGV